MSAVNPWGSLKTPVKQSQFALDLFEEWKSEQAKEISQRGADPAHPRQEDEYNRYMLRQNLNAYICYRELDAYTTCLRDHHLIRTDESSGQHEIHTRGSANEKLCRATHKAYGSCMTAQPNHEAVLQSATLEPHCSLYRSTLFSCMKEHAAEEAQTNHPACTREYTQLLRCGLNHLWNKYWRGITQFTDADEFHLYELSRDDAKRQEYLRVVTTSEAQQHQLMRERREMDKGYFIDPEDAKKHK